jgi:hypothetical protein
MPQRQERPGRAQKTRYHWNIGGAKANAELWGLENSRTTQAFRNLPTRKRMPGCFHRACAVERIALDLAYLGNEPRQPDTHHEGIKAGSWTAGKCL